MIYVLTDVYGGHVNCNKEYNNLEEAKEDLEAEFERFTSDDNDIEYGTHCNISDDKTEAWASVLYC